MSNIVVGSGIICLGRQYAFMRMWKQSRESKKQLSDFKEHINTIADRYADDAPDILEKLARVRDDIREITRGSPATNALLRNVQLSSGSQLSDAESELLRNAYKKMSRLTHPDLGGSVEQFQAVKLAYDNADYRELIDMFVVMQHFPNLFWRQSVDGIEYVTTESQRPLVTMKHIRNLPIFKVVQYHMAGHVQAASSTMRQILIDKLAELHAELNHLRSKYHGNQSNDKKTSSESACEESSNQSDSENANTRYCY